MTAKFYLSSPKLAVTVALLLAAAAGAQTNDEINAGVQLDFSPPGARSLAMGNAFVGLADDATAAYANPAGLLWLTRPEVSFEVRGRRDVLAYPDEGSASGTSTGRGIDTRDDLALGERENEAAGLAYFSYVGIPRDRLRIALYRHEAARLDAEIESQGPFIRSGASRSRLAAVRGNLDLELASFGVSAAWEVHESLWIGAGVALYELHLDAVTRRYASVDLQSDVSRAFFGPVELATRNERDVHTQRSDDEAPAGVLGMLWRPAKGWSVGAVYRQGVEFDLDYTFRWGRLSRSLAVGDVDGDGVLDQAPNLNWTDPGVEDALSGRTSFPIPEMASVGVAWRPRPTLTFSAEVARIGYSAFTPEANLLLNGLVQSESCGDFNAAGVPQARVPCVVARERLDRFSVPGTTEIHLGFEVVLGSRIPWALRGGAWHEPDHSLVFEGAMGSPEDRFAARFVAGEDQVHWTFGFGVAFDRLQVDFGMDLSDRRDTAALSAIYRF